MQQFKHYSLTTIIRYSNTLIPLTCRYLLYMFVTVSLFPCSCLVLLVAFALKFTCIGSVSGFNEARYMSYKQSAVMSERLRLSCMNLPHGHRNTRH